MDRAGVELVAEFRAGRLSVTEVVRDLLGRLDRLAPLVGGVAAMDPARVLADAGRADRRVREGRARPLEGLPFTVKDWIDAEGWPVTGEGVRGRRPARDATAVARLRAAGGIVLAVTSALADNPLHGPTRNPLDPARAPGGSSSGAAALTGAGASPVALGSDSGGSIRLPAAWCGVAGLKPTFGRVPLTGHFPRCGSLEDGRTVIGPLARRVADLAAVLPVIAGPDGLDAGAAPVPLGDPAEVDLRSLRVGVLGGDRTGAALDALEGTIERVVGAPELDVRGEALDITRRYWGRARLTGPQNVELLWDWDRFRRRMLAATAGFDVVLCPAAPGPAPLWRESVEADYVWTLPWSLTGAPAVVVPLDGGDGLPGAVQVVARPWEDHVALAVAALIEAGG